MCACVRACVCACVCDCVCAKILHEKCFYGIFDIKILPVSELILIFKYQLEMIRYFARAHLISNTYVIDKNQVYISLKVNRAFL